jgi:hypothetical protein
MARPKRPDKQTRICELCASQRHYVLLPEHNYVTIQMPVQLVTVVLVVILVLLAGH